jgi:CBS domain containing-hemolysin-like protein
VSGLVTIEDLVEVLVGDIPDEDAREASRIERAADGTYGVDGTVGVGELNEALGTRIPVEEWDTVGGLMQGTLGAIPRQGQRVRVGPLELEAERVDGRRVARVRVRRLPDAASGTATPA